MVDLRESADNWCRGGDAGCRHRRKVGLVAPDQLRPRPLESNVQVRMLLVRFLRNNFPAAYD
jgi:hypothetical protein